MPAQRQTRNCALGMLAAGVLVAGFRSRAKPKRARDDRASSRQAPHVKAAQRLNRAAGLISTSTLLDSGMEHYRGSYRNKAMFTPLIVSALTLGVSLHGTTDKHAATHKFRHATYAAAALTGFVGTLFHLYNVGKRPGGFSWQNLFHGSPLGAPAAVGLAGLLGYYSEKLRDNVTGKMPRVFGVSAGRALAALTSLGLVATSCEAALLHFRGAYHDPFMYVPVTVPPVAAVLLAETATTRPRPPRRFTRWWLRLTAAVGFAGAAFHVFGIHRMMGGWRNWSQNLLNGPPVPAPPSFTGLALAGLAALGLLEDHPDV
ncbi:MAG TPA: hypothetical protein VFL78_01605 [Rhodanobacteraceae bacterium]|nr:hypothetical protein [Rhodanobacteraceae bacterium]